jgi:hypothetical protein
MMTEKAAAMNLDEVEKDLPVVVGGMSEKV